MRILKSKKSTWVRPTDHLPYLRVQAPQATLEVPRYTSVQSQECAFVEGDLSIHWQRRIETSKIIAKHYGIDYQFPLTNPELMQFFHRLPSSYKRRHGKGRYLMRRSMKGLLPRHIVWRQDKAGATAPAAWANLVEVLPRIFLSRIREEHSGIAAEYVDVPKLVKRMERGPVCNSDEVRLAVTVLMLSHLERVLKSECRTMTPSSATIAETPFAP